MNVTATLAPAARRSPRRMRCISEDVIWQETNCYINFVDRTAQRLGARAPTRYRLFAMTQDFENVRLR